MSLETTPLKPTEEQLEIISAVEDCEDNLQINALAGTGKTTTLELIEQASPKSPIIYLAFNKSASDEAKEKFSDGTVVKTLNALGGGIWYKAVGKTTLNKDKMREIFKEHVETFSKEDKNSCWEVYYDVISACAMAKALGYVPEGKFSNAKRLIEREGLYAHLETTPNDITKALIDHCLFISIKTAYKGWIDFNDQVYMPAVFGGTFPRYPFVLVDEAQDLNPVNHAMLQKLIRERVCAVGDRWQSIYAFRGAVTNGMDNIQEKFGCQELNLSVSFRCPQKVVEAARWRVPNFKWLKPGGHVERLKRLPSRDIPEGAAIICRNNAPLFRTALGLLMQSRAVTVSGSELGPKLVRLLEKICDEDDTQEIMVGKIEDWKELQLTKTQAPDRILDTAECLIIFASFGKTRYQACTYVEHMFKQQGSIKLLTGHKAKGLEWDTVYHLDPWLCREDDQDKNLRYVIQTRSKSSLYEVDSKDIIW